MKRRRKAKRKHLVEEVKFLLGENQILYVDPSGSSINPGLNRVFATRQDGKDKVWAPGRQRLPLPFSPREREARQPRFPDHKSGFRRKDRGHPR